MSHESSPTDSSYNQRPINESRLLVPGGLFSLKALPTRAPDEAKTQSRGRHWRALAGSALAGTATYELLPSILHIKPSGSQDAEVAVLAGIGTFLLASLNEAKSLCWSSQARSREEKFQVAQGAGGGAALGAGIAALVKLGTLTALFDGGIVLGLAALGALGAAALNSARREKVCPHCGEEGDCKQRVCRHCYKIFYPAPVELDCDDNITLSWVCVASFLQKQGLNYLDAEALLLEHSPNWGVFPQPNGLQVDCEQFATWVKGNKTEIRQFIGRGEQGRSRAEINEYLSKRGA
jgi:hypothetical protein